MNAKRERIQNKIYEIIRYLDNKDGYNLQKYKDIFEAMSDEEFGKFCNWCNDPNDLTQVDHTIFIQSMPFEEASLQNIVKGLKALGVPAEEYVWFDIQGTGEKIRSRYKIPVGFLHIKRMEQLLSKKNRYTLDNDDRSLKTDQVTGDSKVASISDTEATALLTHGADKIFQELYSARSGDEKIRNNLYRDIALNGYATLDNILKDDSIDNKASLNTLNTYLLAAGIRTDLITNSLILPSTMKKNLQGK